MPNINMNYVISKLSKKEKNIFDLVSEKKATKLLKQLFMKRFLKIKENEEKNNQEINLKIQRKKKCTKMDKTTKRNKRKK